MNSHNPPPLEDRLRSLRLRGLPPDLRRACRDQARTAVIQSTHPRSRWRTLLSQCLPHPAVQGALLVAWCLCFLLHWTRPTTTFVAGPDADAPGLILDPVTLQHLAAQRIQRHFQSTEPTLPFPDIDRPRNHNPFTNRIA